jgi:hypothetical protein
MGVSLVAAIKEVRTMSNAERTAILTAALRKMDEAATELDPLYDEPAIRDVIAELQGMSFGWFGEAIGFPRLLADKLVHELPDA